MPSRKQYKLDWERKRRLDPAYRAKRNAYQSAWKKANREKLREGDRVRGARWRALNPELSRAKSRRYKATHPEANRISWAIRQQRLKNQCPAWADLGKIKDAHREARRLTETTGIPHEVDHVLPLRGRTVSGLHVHGNLRVVSQHANRVKSNKHV